jgi:pyrrolidone-carboxylate peptidase
MHKGRRIVVMGFLPWRDPQRGTDVRENPAAIAANRCALQLAEEGFVAAFVPVPVSGEGITQAIDRARRLEAEVVVAVGQTPTGPRVERFGRVPGAWAPAADGEAAPWPLADDAPALTDALNALSDPAAQTEPFVASDDAGGYFCDHLCVELVRETRRRPLRARFLHVTEIDSCPPAVREARLSMYTKQIRAAVEWLSANVASHKA